MREGWIAGPVGEGHGQECPLGLGAQESSVQGGAQSDRAPGSGGTPLWEAEDKDSWLTSEHTSQGQG